MMDNETVKYVAELAQLSLSEAEISTLHSQLSLILEKISVLREVDTSEIPLDAHTLLLKEILQNQMPEPLQPLGVPPVNAYAQDTED